MTKKKDISKIVSAYQKFGILVILVAEIIIFAILSDKFFATNNLMLVGRQISFFGMSAVGMTMVLLLGEIDISVGSILAFSGCLAVKLMEEGGMHPFVASIIAIAISLVFG